MFSQLARVRKPGEMKLNTIISTTSADQRHIDDRPSTWRNGEFPLTGR